MDDANGALASEMANETNETQFKIYFAIRALISLFYFINAQSSNHSITDLNLPIVLFFHGSSLHSMRCAFSD